MKNTEIINKAAQLLRNGGLVAFPTETVYGLGADATNKTAINKIFSVKGRPNHHPLIVHLATIDQLSEWAVDISEQAFALANRFWPGPLTLVLNKKSSVLSEVTGGQKTIAVRIPKNDIAQQLLQAFGGGIAAPSANKFTRVSATTAKAVAEELGNKIDFILDGGICEIGLESTIVNMTSSKPSILRPGMISVADISQVLGVEIASNSNSHIRVPGKHALHYAPNTKTSLNTLTEIKDLLASEKLKEEELPIACIVFSEHFSMNKPSITWVKMPADPTLYAHQLYQTLRSLDGQHYKQIIIESVPDELKWEAIRDRLMKATGKG